MKRAAAIGVALAGVTLGACHRHDQPQPQSAAARVVSTLRARPATPLGAAIATRFETVAGGLRPAFEAHAPATAQAVFPARASGAVHLQDAATGLGVDVSLADARDVPAEPTTGYVVYPAAHPSGATLVHRPIPEGTEDFLAFESRPVSAQVGYQLALGAAVRGLRLVAGTLELLDAGGAPRLRVAPPYLVGADGARTEATLAVEGCAVDTSPAAPWGRPVTSPGAAICTMRVSWNAETVTYPAVLDPRWTTTGGMIAARQDHTATLLSNNKVLVAGGRTTASATAGIPSAELFDPATATWAAAAAGMTSRFSATATQLNTSSNSTTSGMVLIAGGINNSASVTTAQFYSATTGLWTTAASLNIARHLHTATLMPNGNVLVVGGMTNSAVLNSAAIYNPTTGTGTWTAVSATMSSLRRSHTATLLTSSNSNFNNKVLIAGGNSGGTTSLTTVQLFDTSALTWSTTTALSPAREGHTATKLANGNVLITGGKNVSTFLGTAQVFTIPASGTAATWVSAGTMNALRWAHTATLLSASVLNSGSVLVVGGSTGGSSPTTLVDLWNGTTTWTATTALTTGVQAHTATLLASGAVVIAGGSNDGTASAAAGVVYDPSFALPCTTNSQCATGSCANGVCCDTACNGVCGACNLTGKVGTCSPLTGGTVCRGAVGECDVAETCNGTSTACPADGLKGNGTACTDDGNPCSTDLCNGTSPTCQHAAGNNGSACPDDGNPCTTDRCNGVSTTCQHPAGNNGTACTDDGNPCTTDRCDGVNTTCQHPAGNNGTVCRAAVDQCDVAETCNGTSTACPADAKKANGTTCDDANACTTGDTCQAGSCTGGSTVTCGGADQCHTVGACVPATGCPAPVAKPNGTICNDANACTSGEACQAGSCTGGTAVTCTADQCHTVGACVPATGCPAPVAKANGTTCNDSNACTSGEACQAGSCTGGTAVTCTADQCHTVGACVPATGCPAPVAKANGTTCNDSNACTSGEACQAGSCTGGTAVTCTADQCHAVGACVPATGCPTPVAKANGTTCNDSNACTSGEACQAGTCTGGSTVTCSGADQCHTVGACVPATGCPTPVAKADGTTCDDSNTCTSGEACKTGSCTGGAAVICTGADQCHTVGACVPATGCPAPVAVADGTTCDDANACTQTDACHGGACVGANPIVCAATDSCHGAGTCNTATGFCANPRVADGLACDDGNRCTVGDACRAGTCLPGPATGCSGAAQYLVVIDLGSEQGWSYATGINNHGVVVGTDALITNGIYQLGLAGSRAFSWSETSGVVYLPGTGTQSYAVDINDAGVISGTLGLVPNSAMPFRYDPSVDSLPVYQNRAGNGARINAVGTMTGGAYNPLRMFRLGTGALEFLPSIPDPNPTYMQAVGSAIDGDGTVVGNQLGGEGWYAVRYSDARGIETLNSLLPVGSDWDLKSASAIRSGEIVGWGMHAGLPRAFRMRTTAAGDLSEIVDLGVPPPFDASASNVVAASMSNAAGEIVGSVFDAIPFWPQDAFAYTDRSGPVDLNTLVDPASGWHLSILYAVNDNHEAVGYGFHNGVPRAFKLTLPDFSAINPCPPPADACHLQGLRNPATGLCSNPAKPDGSTCEDGNPCTTGDACQVGACVPGSPVTCTAEDACHVAGVCQPATGTCTNPTAPDGAACNDGNPCTQADACQGGACSPGAPVVCAPSDNCHAAGVCDPTTGVCTNPPLPTGTCQEGAFEYDKAGRLIRDRGALLAYDGYDQLRTVTPAPMGAPQLGPVRIDVIGGDLAGVDGTFPRAVDPQGRVAGYAFTPSGATVAFVSTGPGTTTDINAIAGQTDMDAMGINDAGTVAGTFTDAGGAVHAYRYGPTAGFQDLGATNPPVNVAAINDQNQLAGTLTLAGGATRGFRYTDGTGYEEIGTLAGGSNSFGWSLDGLGNVFGSATVTATSAGGFNQFGHAVVFNDAIGLQDLNRYVDPTSGPELVTANRAAGDWIVGTGTNGSHNVAYRLKASTGMVEALGTWAGDVFGFGINNYGESVGDGYIDAGNTQRSVWFFSDQLGFVDLNTVVGATSGWSLTSAFAITDLGDVIGSGTLNGVVTGFMLHLPLRTSTGGAPTVAEAHTYGYDGLRTSTTTSPGMPGAHVQVWFTQDYTEHDGIREHYVRVGDRLVAKVTAHPTANMGGAGATRGPKRGSSDGRPWLQIPLAVALMLAALAGAALGVAKRRRRWIPGVAGLLSLLLGAASCQMFGLTGSHRSLDWSIVPDLTHYFHQSISPGPQVITNATGALVEERRYEPYGQPIPTVNVAAEPQNILGKLTDPDTGWSYHGARWMQPQSGRWTAPDREMKTPSPSLVLQPWDLNPYQYARQNPALFWDPDGASSFLLGLTGPTLGAPPNARPPAIYKPLVNFAAHIPVDALGAAVTALCTAEGCAKEAFHQWMALRTRLTPFPYKPDESYLGEAAERGFSAVASLASVASEGRSLINYSRVLHFSELGTIPAAGAGEDLVILGPFSRRLSINVPGRGMISGVQDTWETVLFPAAAKLGGRTLKGFAGEIGALTPEIQAADRIIFFTANKMGKLTTQEMEFIQSSGALRLKSTFVYGGVK